MDAQRYIEVTGEGCFTETASRYVADVSVEVRAAKKETVLEEVREFWTAAVASLRENGIADSEIAEGGIDYFRPWYWRKKPGQTGTRKIIRKVPDFDRLNTAMEALEPLRSGERRSLTVDLKQPEFDSSSDAKSNALSAAFGDAKTKAMSFRIVFWPYDHQFLREVSGSGDPSMLEAIGQLASKKIERVPDAANSVLRAQQLAESVINHGFPPRSTDREDEHHRFAVDLLVRPCVLNTVLPSNDFRYLDLLDNFEQEFFGPFPELEDALNDGRAWFGAACPEEQTYGTITRSEVQLFSDRCSEFRSRYAEPEWEIDPIIDVFQVAVDRNCDIWFAI